MCDHNQKTVGSDALSGIEEKILFNIFDATDEERWIEGWGDLIMIIHPSDSNLTKSYDDVRKTDSRFPVPRYHKVKVINAHVKMTT